MHITLTPSRASAPMTVERLGDALVIDGETFDFSPLADGATLPADAIDSDAFPMDVARIDGALHVTLVLPHSIDAPRETRFPDPIIDPPDGLIPLPPFSTAPDA